MPVPGEVTVVNETGEIGSLPVAEAQRAAAVGQVRLATGEDFAKEARRAREAEYGGLGGPALAFSHGAINAMTLGGADAAAIALARKFYGEKAAQQIKADAAGYSEENPYSHLGGEAFGMVAPALVSGGTGLLARGASALGAPMRGVMAAGGAVERGLGAALGGGKLATGIAKSAALGTELGIMGGAQEFTHQLSEEALGNHALNAEKILAHAGKDFVLGAALGGGAQILGALAKGAGSRIFGKAAEEGRPLGERLADKMEENAGEHLWRALRGPQKLSEAAATYAGGPAEVGKILAEELPKYTGKGIARTTIEDVAQAVPKMAEASGQKMGASLKEMASVQAEKDIAPTWKAVRDAAESDLVKSFSATSKAKNLAEAAESKALPTHKWGDVQKANEFFSNMETRFGLNPESKVSLDTLWEIRREADGYWLNNKNPLMPNADSIYRDLRGTLERQVLGEADKISQSAGKALSADYVQSKKVFQVAQMAKKAAEKGMAKEATNLPFGISDKIAGGVGAVVTSVVGGGPLGALAAGGASGLASKVIRGRSPFVLADVEMKAASRLRAMAETSGEVTRQIKRGTRSLLEPTAGQAATPATVYVLGKTAEARAKAVDRVRMNLEDMAGQASKAAARLEPLNSVAPNTAAAFNASLAKNMAYLASKLPAPQYTGMTLAPWAEKPKYSDSDVLKFSRVLRAASDPLTVLEDVQNSTLTKESVDTVRELYPMVFKEMQDEFTALLFDQKKHKQLTQMPIERRMQISILFGINSPLTDTGFLRSIQESQSQGAQAAPPPGSVAEPQGAMHDAKAASLRADSLRTDTEEIGDGQT